jgi:hypothetical protein
MKQFLITPSAGKRLIGIAMAVHPLINEVLNKGTLVIIAGTTNGYVAKEIFKNTGIKDNLNRSKFIRGISLPPNYRTTSSGRLPNESGFPGDVVIKDGQWIQGKTIFDVIDNLKEGDIILKGANAVNMEQKRAAVLVGHPEGGTIVAALKAFSGKRVRIIVPVGLEKRVSGDMDKMVTELNAPGVKGLRFMQVPGEIFTEIEALSLLTGAEAELFAGGGVCGAEGSIWLAVSGTPESEQKAEELIKSVAEEPPFNI